MLHSKGSGYAIAKYFERIEGGARGRPPKYPSKMFQLDRIEGTGQGEARPTCTNTYKNNKNSNNNNRDNNTRSSDREEGDENTNVYAYGGTEGGRKGKRNARLGPQKIKSPQTQPPRAMR